jgi:hypothetical protein
MCQFEAYGQSMDREQVSLTEMHFQPHSSSMMWKTY